MVDSLPKREEFLLNQIADSSTGEHLFYEDATPVLSLSRQNLGAASLRASMEPVEIWRARVSFHQCVGHKLVTRQVQTA